MLLLFLLLKIKKKKASALALLTPCFPPELPPVPESAGPRRSALPLSTPPPPHSLSIPQRFRNENTKWVKLRSRVEPWKLGHSCQARQESSSLNGLPGASARIPPAPRERGSESSAPRPAPEGLLLLCQPPLITEQASETGSQCPPGGPQT